MTIQENTIVYPLPNSEVIEEIEKDWRVFLPNDYKAFIMRNNGGVPNQIIFRCNNRGYVITRFLCIFENTQQTENGWYDIEVIMAPISDRLTANEDLIGVDILPIAAISGGDFVCLDYRKNKENPNVCVWSYDESGEFDPVTYWAADTFSEFVSMLESEVSEKSEIEKDWRVLVPNDYKAFIIRNNGGIPNPNILRCNGRVYTITRFLCILKNIQETENGWYDISVIIESQIGERFSANGDLIGEGILPIAATSGGDYICLDYTDNKESPTICVWSYDESYESDEFDSMTYWVAKTFSEFLSMLE